MEADWYVDPLGRYDGRFFDGEDWTDQVSDSGVLATDPDWPPMAGGATTASTETQANTQSDEHLATEASQSDGGLQAQEVSFEEISAQTQSGSAIADGTQSSSAAVTESGENLTAAGLQAAGGVAAAAAGAGVVAAAQGDAGDISEAGEAEVPFSREEFEKKQLEIAQKEIEERAAQRKAATEALAKSEAEKAATAQKISVQRAETAGPKPEKGKKKRSKVPQAATAAMGAKNAGEDDDPEAKPDWLPVAVVAILGLVALFLMLYFFWPSPKTPTAQITDTKETPEQTAQAPTSEPETQQTDSQEQTPSEESKEWVAAGDEAGENAEDNTATEDESFLDASKEALQVGDWQILGGQAELDRIAAQHREHRSLGAESGCFFGLKAQELDQMMYCGPITSDQNESTFDAYSYTSKVDGDSVTITEVSFDEGSEPQALPAGLQLIPDLGYTKTDGDALSDFERGLRLEPLEDES